MYLFTALFTTMALLASAPMQAQTLIITRGTTTTRIDSPGTRVAAVSNFKFEPTTEINPLKSSS